MKNGKTVDFDYIVQENDFFSIYPYFYQLTEKNLLIKDYSAKPRFILDVHLGKLARYLRQLSFDSAYDNQYKDQEIVDISLKERRIILSRDLGLLKRSRVKWAKFIFNDQPQLQLEELNERFDLNNYYESNKSRCVDCNSQLIEVKKEEIIDRLEPKTKKYYDQFVYCTNCDKIYWQGSHFQAAKKLLK